MASPFSSQPRPKTVRRMELQKVLGLPLTGKRIQHADGRILHPTKGWRNRDDSLDDRYLTEQQEINSANVARGWGNVFYSINKQLQERAVEVAERSKAYYKANAPQNES